MVKKASEEMRNEIIEKMEGVDGEKILDKVVVRLVGKDYLNLDMLFTDDYLGMKIIYTYDVDDKYALKLTPGNLETYGIDENVLRERALRNTMKLDMVLEPMFKIMQDIGADVPENIPLPVLMVGTNPEKQYGAAILFTDKIHEFLKKIKMSAFILPSSIHEVLVMPDDGTLNPKDLKEMVCIVNNEQVLPVEQLSDNVFYMDLETGEITIAA